MWPTPENWFPLGHIRAGYEGTAVPGGGWCVAGVVMAWSFDGN
jgi:hypothetical protein